MPRYSLTVESDDPNELVGVLRQLVDATLSTAVVRAVSPAPLATGSTPVCPIGHGPMVYRDGGTVRSGPRLGQTYPPFWSCSNRDCKETREVQ